jgi:RNA polymerase sigma-54 factor
VIPMSELFCTSDAPREALRGLLASERQPLTDGQLAQALAARGHRIARRTVAKYRAQLGQPQRALR